MGQLARLALADLFLDTLPYNAHATGSDALWAGVPVLGVRGGGPEDLILPGVNGWLVDREDPTLLAEQIVRCLDPRQWPEQRRDEAHLARFQAMAVAEQWRKIYASL